MSPITASFSLDQCRQAVVARGLQLPQSIRDSVEEAGRRLKVSHLSKQELEESLRRAEAHNPMTGRRVDADGALALREEIYAREMHTAVC